MSATPSNTPCQLQLSPPIGIPIANTTVSDGTPRRGVILSVGTPKQDLVFVVSGRLHNTIIYDNVDSCFNGEPSKHCATRQGGLFNSNESTSWSPAERFEDLRVVGDVDANHENDLFGNDTLAFNSTLSLEHFGFGISRDKREEMNVIGLKRNTPFLHALRSAGLIPSSTWAYYQGWTGAEIGDQLNGSLVLGGYDAAKVDGNNITAPLVEDNPNCVSGLVVDLVDMKMNLKNGTNVSILGSSGPSTISGCISPDLPLMYVPPTIMSTFVKASGVTVTGNSGGINFNGTLVSGEASYDGDLTVSLSGGLDITIPNHQLVIPSYRVNEEGRVFIENSSNREVLMNSLQDGNSNMLLLGRAFLTSAYLLVDNDHLEFTLWKSEPTQSEKLVPLGIPTCRRDSPLASSTAGSQNSSSETPLPHNEHSSGGLRPGAIAGIVLGAIFFVTGLLFGVLLFRQRRAKQSYAQKRQSTDIITGLEDSNDNKGLQEMPTDYHEPKEMPLTQHPPYDQTPYEMPAQSPPQELSTPGHGRQEVG